MFSTRMKPGSARTISSVPLSRGATRPSRKRGSAAGRSATVSMLSVRPIGVVLNPFVESALQNLQERLLYRYQVAAGYGAVIKLSIRVLVVDDPRDDLLQHLAFTLAEILRGGFDGVCQHHDRGFPGCRQRSGIPVVALPYLVGIGRLLLRLLVEALDAG